MACYWGIGLAVPFAAAAAAVPDSAVVVVVVGVVVVTVVVVAVAVVGFVDVGWCVGGTTPPVVVERLFVSGCLCLGCFAFLVPVCVLSGSQPASSPFLCCVSV